MKVLLCALFALSLSPAFAYDDDGYGSDTDFNVETARDVLEGGEASEEFLAAKERLKLQEDRANLTDEEAAMMLLSKSEEF